MENKSKLGASICDMFIFSDHELAMHSTTSTQVSDQVLRFLDQELLNKLELILRSKGRIGIINEKN